MIMSNFYIMQTLDVFKIKLSLYDNIQYLPQDGIHTYACGHCKINEEQAA